MGRSQFTFYESFFTAIRRLKSDKAKAALYDAICSYALYGEEPELDDVPAAMFDLIRPNLDSSRKKADSGKKGGEKKQSGSKTKANLKQVGTEKEKEKEKEGEIENECYPPTPLSSESEAKPEMVVVSDYLNRINPEASPASIAELRGFAEAMGADVCKRAFDIALDEKKTTWSYIRGILRNRQAQGVRCLADWDALDQRRGEKEHGNSHGEEYANLRSETDGLFGP